MMMPSIFGENLFDDFMDDFSFPTFPNVDKELYGKHAKNLMKTDVKETGNDWIKMRKIRKVTISEKNVMRAA